MGSEQDKNLEEILGFDPTKESSEKSLRSPGKPIETPKYPLDIQVQYKKIKSELLKGGLWKEGWFETDKLFCSLRKDTASIRQYNTYDESVLNPENYNQFPDVQSIIFEQLAGKWNVNEIRFDNELGVTNDMISIFLSKKRTALFYWSHEPLKNFSITYRNGRLASSEMNTEVGDHVRPVRKDSEGWTLLTKGSSSLHVPTYVNPEELYLNVFDDERLLSDPFSAPTEADTSWRFMNVFELFQADWRP